MTFLGERMSFRCFNFLLATNFLVELQCEERGVLEGDKSEFSHYVARATFGDSPKREAISYSVDLLREMFYEFNRILTKYLRLLHGMFSARFLVLISNHI